MKTPLDDHYMADLSDLGVVLLLWAGVTNKAKLPATYWRFSSRSTKGGLPIPRRYDPYEISVNCMQFLLEFYNKHPDQKKHPD